MEHKELWDCLLRNCSHMGTSSTDSGHRDRDLDSLGQEELFGLCKSIMQRRKIQKSALIQEPKIMQLLSNNDT